MATVCGRPSGDASTLRVMARGRVRPMILCFASVGAVRALVPRPNDLWRMLGSVKALRYRSSAGCGREIRM